MIYTVPIILPETEEFEMIFRARYHHINKALEYAGIYFPTTKSDILEKICGVTVEVDFGKRQLLSDIIAAMKPEIYENACAFYCALISADTQAGKAINKY